jgi:hypothetical protein
VVPLLELAGALSLSLSLSLSFSHTGRLTGMVGTALYVSPEVQGSTKSAYNQVQETLGKGKVAERGNGKNMLLTEVWAQLPAALVRSVHSPFVTPGRMPGAQRQGLVLALLLAGTSPEHRVRPLCPRPQGLIQWWVK